MTPTPWTDWQHIIIFGGSFDPPHWAHITLPQQVREAVGADGIVYVPAARAPHKLDKKQTESHHRLAMLRRALDRVEHTAISTIELDRASDGRPSYTVDTLEAITTFKKPGATLRLLIGNDQVAIFEKWHRWQDVEQLAEPVVMVRPPQTAEQVLAGISDQSRRAIWQKRMVEVERIDESSTLVREALARGDDVGARVGRDVADYIAEHALYRS